ncbi:hypothetical protein HML84_06945 [Alcanivorax sp. IO_7]|nr:hypothetical protein HML84_06945 [Alcanivorax sp. IO_7]
MRGDGGDQDVLEGRVEQRPLAFGGLLVLSRVRALRPYEARSRPDFCLSLAWLGQGEAHLRTRRDGPLRMTGATAVTMLETGDSPLHASHPAGPLLHGLNLSVRDLHGLGDERLQDRLRALRRAGRSRLAPGGCRRPCATTWARCWRSTGTGTWRRCCGRAPPCNCWPTPCGPWRTPRRRRRCPSATAGCCAASTNGWWKSRERPTPWPPWRRWRA